MIRRITIASLFLLILSSNSLGQADAERYVASDGMFSISIPKGWILREIPGRKYKVAVGQPIGDFTPNINIVDELYSGSLDEYVDGNLNVLPKMYEKVGYKNFKVLRRDVFTTTSKQAGVRVITQSEINGNFMRQTFFFFDGKDGRKLVVTCTTPAAGGEDQDSVFEKSLKTFQSETPQQTTACSGPKSACLWSTINIDGAYEPDRRLGVVVVSAVELTGVV